MSTWKIHKKHKIIMPSCWYCEDDANSGKSARLFSPLEKTSLNKGLFTHEEKKKRRWLSNHKFAVVAQKRLEWKKKAA